MSKNYDNWGRLVRAVLLREHDMEIAMRSSTDSNNISSCASSTFDRSFSSTSQLDQPLVVRDRTEIPMDYSDLTLDHSVWKTMLPPGKQEVLWKSASLSFFVDQRTGKNCFLLGATKLELFPQLGIEQYWKKKPHELGVAHWEMKPHQKTRFSEVAELVDWFQFRIGASIKTKMLSPKTLYAAYFVFRFNDNEKYRKPQTANSTISLTYSKSDVKYHTENVVQFEVGDVRADEWTEIKLGDFYVGNVGDNNGDVKVKLVEAGGCKIGCIIVEGIEFRPLNGRKNINMRGKWNVFKL